MNSNWDLDDENIYGEARQGSVATVDNNKQIVETSEDNISLQTNSEDVFRIAEEASKRVAALNTIMSAALKITTEEDWVITGGKPYLQATGATKVARLFGIEWTLLPGFPKYELKSDGHRVYEYRMKLKFNGKTIEMDGARSSASTFFTGSKEKKSPEEIDMMNVQKSAFANCLNRGIKALIPGLQGINQDTLQKAGFNLSRIAGYTFKEGTKGGKTQAEKDEGLVCADCGMPITQKIASYAQGKFGRYLCYECQKIAVGGGNKQIESKEAPKAQTQAQPQKKQYETPVMETVPFQDVPPQAKPQPKAPAQKQQQVNDEDEYLKSFDQYL